MVTARMDCITVLTCGDVLWGLGPRLGSESLKCTVSSVPVRTIRTELATIEQNLAIANRELLNSHIVFDPDMNVIKKRKIE